MSGAAAGEFCDRPTIVETVFLAIAMYSARDFAAAEIEPNAAEWDRAHAFPPSLLTKLGELGLMGACVPEEYGGAGADFLSYILVLE